MYKVDDYLIFGKDVCKVKGVEEKKYNDEDYYVLAPIKDETLKLEIPVSSTKIRDLITEDDLNNLIEKIPSIETIQTEDKFIESEYKRLLSSGNEEDLIKVIKTTYLRNEERVNNKKRKAEKDSIYFKEAEEALYSQVSVIKNISLEEAKEYFINKIKDLTN